MDKQQTLKAACRTLGLTHTRETLEKILHDAEKEGWSYLDFLVFVTDSEILFKQEKAKNKRIMRTLQKSCTKRHQGFKNVMISSSVLPLFRYASMIASASIRRFCSCRSFSFSASLSYLS